MRQTIILLSLFILLLTPRAAHTQAPERALAELERLHVPFTVEEFVYHAAQGDFDIVKLFLEAGMNPDTRHVDSDDLLARQSTPLFVAASLGQTEIVNLLLSAGADIDGTDTRGWSAMMAAAETGHTETVLTLIDQGAAIDGRDAIGQTPLMMASLNGDIDIVRALLAAGADLEAGNNLGQTPLIQAAMNGRLEVVKLLIAKGADVNARTDADMTALHWALSSMGLSGIDVEKCEKCLDMIETLLNAGADVNAVEHLSGQTPLIQAAGDASPDIVKELLDKGARIDAESETGETSLMRAALFGGLENTKLLLEEGADIEAKDGHGSTVLMKATSGGNIETIQFLLEQGANPGEQDYEGKTALMMAACGKPRERSAQIARLLLDGGVKPDAKMDDGTTALMRAAECNTVETTRLLLDYGAGVNTGNKDGITPLMSAVTSHNPDVVALLLARGANPDIKDMEGKTALMHAVWNGSKESVQALIESNADLNLTDNLGMTALSTAMFLGHDSLMKMLTEAGAKTMPDETRGNISEKLLASAAITHLTCDYHKVADSEGNKSISIDVHLRNTADEEVVLPGVKVPIEVRIYSVKSGEAPGKTIDRLVYSKISALDCGDRTVVVSHEDMEQVPEYSAEMRIQIGLEQPSGESIESDYCAEAIICGFSGIHDEDKNSVE